MYIEGSREVTLKIGNHTRNIERESGFGIYQMDMNTVLTYKPLLWSMMNLDLINIKFLVQWIINIMNMCIVYCIWITTFRT